MKKLTSQESIKLFITGNIKDEVADELEVAFEIIKMFIQKGYSSLIENRYSIKINGNENEEVLNAISDIARKRGNIKRGNELDLEKTSKMIIKEIRDGILGKIFLD